MARPKRATVDYFPHDCNHQTTIFILEEKYGNDGYAFWFKLLEILGSTEGHFFDCNIPGKWQFLQAKTHLSGDTCNEILNLLAEMEAIDSELWKEKIIWSENFIKRIADVYRKRRMETPSREDIRRHKPPSPARVSGEKTGAEGGFPEQKLQLTGVSAEKTPQIKLKKTKLNNISSPSSMQKHT